MSFSRDEVYRLARLARIGLRYEEADRFAGELSAIVGYVDRLQAVDVEGVDDSPVFPEAQTPVRDILHGDAGVCERIIQQFPDRMGDLLRVPAVFADRVHTPRI